MDQPCSFEELRGCLRDISQVNRLTFAYRPTLHWLDYVYSVMPRQEKPLHIVDVGCGYGDMLRRIYEWAEWRRVPVVLTGIDLNKDAIRAAREVTHPGRVTYLAGDAYSFEPAGGIGYRSELADDAPYGGRGDRRVHPVDGCEDADWVVYQRSASAGGALSFISCADLVYNVASLRQTRWAGFNSAEFQAGGLAGVD